MVKIGDCFVHEKGTFFQVIEIIDDNYCICYMKEYKEPGTVYGNWKQSIANILSGVDYGVMRKLTPAEIILYGPAEFGIWSKDLP